MRFKGIIVVSILIAVAIILVTLSMRNIPVKANEKPIVYIDYPRNGDRVYGILTITGRSEDLDGDVKSVEIKIDDSSWDVTDGTYNWSFTIDTKDLENGYHSIYARAWDGTDYSDIVKLRILVENEIADNIHRWALFVSAANVEDIEIKLGNGMLELAEDMARYFISDLGYPASHITILFDDGWIRDKNGEGKRISTLQERNDKIDYVSYGPATKDYLISSIERIKDEANKYNDSEVFIWISGHGVGDPDKKITGGKILERSEVVLWDGTIQDKELGELLEGLKAKLCLIVDSCYSGGFANRIIFNVPSLLRSNIPKDGRIVITGESKFSIGYASNVSGPLFTQLWFEGLKTGKADGFRKGLFGVAKRSHLNIFKDGRVSVEEAFYYAKYMIRKEYRDFIWMQPQMNDMYPHKYPFNRGEMFLGD